MNEEKKIYTAVKIELDELEAKEMFLSKMIKEPLVELVINSIKECWKDEYKVKNAISETVRSIVGEYTRELIRTKYASVIQAEIDRLMQEEYVKKIAEHVSNEMIRYLTKEHY